ncbi:MAG: rhomboid family intramembrane serine protease [Planctomycetales bacterium]|nr:rhomboid family intramembrane serine protease [bacterium]UNM07540.1 MAG: rhomboid family intramembrane serine protease [Planctomycetales bacterium]
MDDYQNNPYEEQQHKPRIRREEIPPTPVTWGILALCVAVFMYANVLRADELYQLELAFDPAHGKTVPGLFIHMFVHDNFLHLLSNGIGLYIVGRWMEIRYGSFRFFLLFYLSALVAGMAQAVHAPGYALVGASGGLFALFAAFVRHYPNVRFYIIFPPIPWPLPAWLLVGLMAMYNAVLWVGADMQISWLQNNLAYMAHLVGLLSGFILSLIMIPPGKEVEQRRVNTGIDFTEPDR